MGGSAKQSLASLGTEFLKEAGSVGLVDTLKEACKEAIKCPHVAGIATVITSHLTGLAAGPLVWGVLLLGGCWLQHRSSHHGKGTSDAFFRRIEQRLTGIESAIRDQKDAAGLVRELLAENDRLREADARNGGVAAVDATVLAQEIAAQIGLNQERFQLEVFTYLDTIEVRQRKQDAKLDEMLDLLRDRATNQDLVRSLLSDNHRLNAELRSALTQIAGAGTGGADLLLERLRAGDRTSLMEFTYKSVDEDGPGFIKKLREKIAVCLVLGESARVDRDLQMVLALRPDDVEALHERARLMLATGSLTQAEALGLRGMAITMDGSRERSVFLNVRGDVQVKQGDLPGALESYRAGMEIAKALAQRDPRNTDWQRDVAVSWAKIGDLCLRQSDREGARQALTQGREIMARLAGVAPSNMQWKQDLAWFDELLEGL